MSKIRLKDCPSTFSSYSKSLMENRTVIDADLTKDGYYLHYTPGGGRFHYRQKYVELVKKPTVILEDYE